MLCFVATDWWQISANAEVSFFILAFLSVGSSVALLRMDEPKKHILDGNISEKKASFLN